MAAVGELPETGALPGFVREVSTHDAAGNESRMVAVSLPASGRTTAEDLAQALRERTGQEALDCVVLEHPVSLHDDWRANNRDHATALLSAWSVMEQLAELGVTRAVGVANAGDAVVDLLLEHASLAPVLNQIEFHPYLTSPSLVRHCRERGVAVQALCFLGPRDADGGHPVLDNPKVSDVARAHDRTPAQIVAAWCLAHVDGVVTDGWEDAGRAPPDLELSGEEMVLLDGLDCGYRDDRSPSTLASIYGNVSDEPMRVETVDTQELEVGCHKVLYAPVSRSEAFNRGFSFFVWRNVFNLPATVRYRARRHTLSSVSARIRADLDRDGYAVTSVAELGCETEFERVRSRAAALIGNVMKKENEPRRTYRYKADLGTELADVPELRSAIDAYFGLETIVDDVSLITIPARVESPRMQQLWHTDVEDLYTVKVYTFLSDVDELSGPLEYIAESHPKGEFALETAELWKHTFVKDPTPTHSFQVPDELLFKHVRPDLLRNLEGPAGTVLVFDARGLHRGGHVLRGVRQVAVTSHIAPNTVHPWGEPRSRWNALLSRFRWENNVKLRSPANGG